MRGDGVLWLLSLSLGCAAAPVASAPPRLACVDEAAPDGSAASALHWIIGDWASRGDGAETVERWCVGEGGVLMGDHRTTEDGREVHSEAMRIEPRGDTLVYVVSSSHEGTIELAGTVSCANDTLDNCTESCEAVFSNPEHDPAWITYRQCLQADVLHKRIVGNEAHRNGHRHAMWTFRRRR